MTGDHQSQSHKLGLLSWPIHGEHSFLRARLIRSKVICQSAVQARDARDAGCPAFAHQ